jgi:hypothetical protein
MLERLNDLPYGLDGLSAVGKVSREDYEQVFEPVIELARRDGRRMRFLYQFGPRFEGFTPSGAWEDAKLGLHSMRFFEGCAIVTDNAWIREASKLMGFLLPCPIRAFFNSQQDAATEWLQSLPKGSAVSHRLSLEDGVVVIDVKQMLHAYDFDALVLAVDTWLESGGKLRGLVLHAHDYTGWENLSSFFRHLRFVKDQHTQLERVALAGDRGVTGLAPQLGEHFVSARIRTFDYDAVEAAVAWVRGDDTPRRALPPPPVRHPSGERLRRFSS